MADDDGPDWEFIRAVAKQMYELHPDMAVSGEEAYRPRWVDLTKEAQGYWVKDARLAIAAVTIAQANETAVHP